MIHFSNFHRCTPVPYEVCLPMRFSKHVLYPVCVLHYLSISSIISSLDCLVNNKCKGKGHPRTGHEGPEGEQRYSSTLSSTSALDAVGGQYHVPSALPTGQRPGTHCLGGWLGPRAGLDGRRKSPSPPGFDPRSVQPVASRYTD
jgi:hypothetical protein